ncbi:tail fiber domain-containing protein [Stenotrophomonas bentonitica]|uniref:tail fiber domain-containing protein n=1 Tax=Stenotrophomonas bentonitica TaxID=1450134 RepID=UPI0036E24C26
MPIDFPTVKYADPTAFPPSAPAATDTLMARTAAGADKSFALGNLAGLAPLAIANDQAPFVSGGAWGAYSLTAAGRALSGVAGTANTFPYFSAANVVTLAAVGATGLSSLGAATPAAGRAAIGAADDGAVVHLTGSETVAGTKTFTGAQIRMQNTSPGFWLDETDGGYSTYVVLDSNAFQVQCRSVGFGGLVDIPLSMSFGPTSADRAILFGNLMRPRVDNNVDVGTTAFRVRTYYGVNAAINTSDARLKTDPRQLRDAEFKAASAIARLPAVWRWLSRVHGDENCEPEGKEARKHFGPTVQAAIAVMEANGLDPFAYSFICYDEWEALPEQWHEWEAQEAVLDDDGNVVTPAVEAGRELVQEAREAGDRYSFRKEELLCFIVRALAQEIDGLSARVAALEAGRNP